MADFSSLSTLPREVIAALTKELGPDDTAAPALNVRLVTTDVTAAISDLLEVDSSGAPITVTLPSADADSAGKQIVVAVQGTVGAPLANNVTLVPAVGEDISTYTSYLIDIGRTALNLISNGNGRWIIY
jgi:hypothetical protein